MLGSFLSLDQQNVVKPQFFHTINGTFVLELLTKFLKISKTYISEQSFAGMYACSQNGKIFTVVGCLYTFPVDRKIPQEIFEDSLCVYGIAFEQFSQEGGVETFIENKA